jgi:hypothetical protein
MDSSGKEIRRTPNRWRAEVQKDIGVLGMKYWTKVVMDRLALHDLVEKSKSRRVVGQKKMKKKNSHPKVFY